MIESKLTELLEAKAASFHSPPLVPESVLCRARARRARNVGALALVAVALSAASAVALRMSPDQRAFAAFTLIDEQVVGANGSAQAHSAQAHGDAGGEPLTRVRLYQHVRCMRAHGVNVPGPEVTPESWRISRQGTAVPER